MWGSGEPIRKRTCPQSKSTSVAVCKCWQSWLSALIWNVLNRNRVAGPISRAVSADTQYSPNIPQPFSNGCTVLPRRTNILSLEQSVPRRSAVVIRDGGASRHTAGTHLLKLTGFELRQTPCCARRESKASQFFAALRTSHHAFMCRFHCPDR